MAFERVAVVGAGAWGTALAQAAAIAGRTVTLVGRDPAAIDDINRNRRNSAHLGDQPLSDRITGALALPDADLVILAVPAQASRAALQPIAAALAHLPVVLTA
jgi:glycerol-3-phosphate dehydrogenase (NAD(P)+)